MDIAITLVIQGLVFFFVAWVVMRFGWPHIIAAIEARQKKIADGLAAAGQSQKDLEEAKGTAAGEAQRIVAQAHEEVSRETTRAREQLSKEVGKLAVEGEIGRASCRERVLVAV